ncbi:excisionase [Caballeronia sp. LZ035]|uniref:excisionase n=1 Tax=Caballeronia sp. LZ035 TaxID=3038568 RepID=UPI0028577734|nr:excisionase [Caballeronia sp. LZ035]MDR5761911.1 excisionase [Caballeronia sp. LZ035]
MNRTTAPYIAEAARAALVSPASYVTIALAAIITGLTEKAIRRKIEDGKWIEGREYRRSPDGGIFIDLRGYERWVERAAA